ncbi:hypothetical protein NDU88_003366 [Pleurodeles waltl]|uniref:Uncharacterized protein n=1 Tax=Pleurodeles waltl TaxID=8319 RepID=A0AAV7MVE1_PLEWA|nr:hypothetical protein NDU88_003366 [Pleurodeles waltl]
MWWPSSSLPGATEAVLQRDHGHVWWCTGAAAVTHSGALQMALVAKAKDDSPVPPGNPPAPLTIPEA